MSKALIGVIALLAIGGGAYFFMNSQGSDLSGSGNEITRSTGETEEKKSSDEDFIGTGALVALMDMGVPLTCTFSYEDASERSEGVYKQSGSKYRVEVSATGDYGAYDTTIINDGSRSYIWGEGTEGSTAMVYTNIEGEDDGFFGGEEDGEFSVDEAVEYDCKPGIVSGSEFTPPSNIDFMDMDQMMQGMFQ